MASRSERDTLCWRCKCATNPQGTNCPWANQGEPVPNWEATPGMIFRTSTKDGIRVAQSYRVRKCPLFIEDGEFHTTEDVLQELVRTLGITYSTARSKFQTKVKQWEALTGRKMPIWIKNRGVELEEDE